jgi:hypothetical protein
MIKFYQGEIQNNLKDIYYYEKDIQNIKELVLPDKYAKLVIPLKKKYEIPEWEVYERIINGIHKEIKTRNDNIEKLKISLENEAKVIKEEKMITEIEIQKNKKPFFGIF